MRNSPKGMISLFAALAGSVIMGGSLYVMQTLAVMDAKQKRARFENLTAFYSSEIIAHNVHTRIRADVWPGALPNGIGSLSIPNRYLTDTLPGISATSYNSASYIRGTPVNFKKTADFDSKETLYEGPTQGFSYNMPTAPSDARHVVCGRRKFPDAAGEDDRERMLCLAMQWSAPTVDLKAVNLLGQEVDILSTLIPLVPLGSVTVTLKWNAPSGAYPNGCSLRNSAGNILSTSLSSAGLNLSLSASSVLTLTCRGPGGTRSDSINIGIGAALPPTADLKINGNDGNFSVGNNATLVFTWTSARASTCSISTIGNVAPNSSPSLTRTGTNATVTYTLTCTGASGSASDSITVTYSPNCAGFWYRDHCWYRGARGGNCTSACASHGGYSQGTRTVAGSAGTNAHCGAVLNGLGMSTTIFGMDPTFDVVCTTVSAGGVGCGILDIVGAVQFNECRITSNTTPAASGNFYDVWFFTRACACNE